MANIRILNDKFKDILKESDATLNNLLDNIKNNKPDTLIFLSGYSLLDKNYKLDLFQLAVTREGIELAIKVEEKCCSGTDNLEEIVRLLNLKAFVERMEEELNKFYALCEKKMEDVEEIGTLHNQKIEHFFKFELTKKKLRNNVLKY